jgi:hypothetical protein
MVAVGGKLIREVSGVQTKPRTQGHLSFEPSKLFVQFHLLTENRGWTVWLLDAVFLRLRQFSA